MTLTGVDKMPCGGNVATVQTLDISSDISSDITESVGFNNV
jgi:hypothetical protein